VSASQAPAFSSLAATTSAVPNDRLGEGDTIAVSIFEAGGLASFSSSGDLTAPSSATETLPHLVVAQDGSIMVPYAGHVHVAGLTVDAAASAIQSALRGRAINPQVEVSLVGNVANSVIVMGEVRSVGRVALSANSERLFDVLATAGGPTKPAGDIMVTIVRGDTNASASLAAVLRDPSQNIRLAPHDQVRLIYAPRKYSTFGAFGHVSELQIEDEGLSLAEAISRNGGLDTTTANAKSVLLFRFERPEVARAIGVNMSSSSKGVPVIYRLNLLDPRGFFVANNFAVEANDLIYVPRSDATELRKFLDLVSMVSSITYNLTVVPAFK
jgi:polysaccharide export outer membrane protein